MDVKVYPSPINGTVPAIPSKSDVHRLLICAALSDGKTEIYCPAVSEDIMATAHCLNALGAEIEYRCGTFYVTPIIKVSDSPLLDCGESGSTLRFMLPVAAALSENSAFTGHGRLPDRPIKELKCAMESGGAVFSAEKLPFSVVGKIRSSVYTLPGNVSSQYITGLLLALPLVGGGEIRLTAPLESASYVDMTISSMSAFGVSVERTEYGWRVPAADYTTPGKVIAEGDWSNAAFFLVAGCNVIGLNPESSQGDRVIFDNMRRIKNSAVIDLTDTPDMLPALAVYAAFNGGAEFRGVERLRIKESDRIMTVKNMIDSLGGSAHDLGDRFIVDSKPLAGGTVNAYGDHRIAMAAAVGASFGKTPSIILGAEAVNKSYPGFWDDFSKLGGKNDVL